LIADILQAPRVHRKQTINESFTLSKPPQNILGKQSIINKIHQTCIQLACKEVKKVLQINDVVPRQDTKPLIQLTSGPIMVRKWLVE
jgi:hypothetical protein